MQTQISDIQILELSKKTKSTATQIIKESRLIEILSEFGNPIIIGSYELDLMIDQDIDIIVKTKSLKESAINSLHKLINSEIAHKYEFGDFIKFPKSDRPNGYIVNLKLKKNGESWEIEIWFLKEIKTYQKQIEEYLSKLNRENRLTILKEKYQRKISGKDKHELSSFKIYSKILN